ncbi:ribonuclease HIII [Virgibacillus xinjiangensis]|uniref:Ribonuclease HIII n=1 Tax=Virgibacillus xinjiangensis TaxID=393090 RepID=A0ABV7CUV4_9BACI
MPQNVQKVSMDTIKEMKSHYIGSLQSTPQGAMFRAKTPHAVITAYKSGKVLYQGKSPETEMKKWDSRSTSKPVSSSKKNQTSPSFYHPPANLFLSHHIGTDEAGTGDYFGPITVAALYVEGHQIEELKQMGVRDSKDLSDPVIRRLSKKVVAMNLPYSLLVLHNPKYNRLQKKGWSQGKMKAMLHQHAINNLRKKIGEKPLNGILIDQFCEPTIYKKHIASEGEKLLKDTYFMTKAESYSIAVAAASIIARTSFLNEMDKLSHKLGITLPKGASKKVDQSIAELIRKHGTEMLDSCGKTHFANTKKADQYL